MTQTRSLNRIPLWSHGVLLCLLWGASHFNPCVGQNLPQRLPPVNPRAVPGKPAASRSDQPYRFPVNETLERRLNAVQPLIREKRWSEAMRLLQSLIDQREDAFDRATAETSPQSLQSRTRALLKTVVEQDPAAYETQFGGEAQRLLNEAQSRGNWPQVAEVTRRFGFTQAGMDATRQLAHYHLNQGRHLAAAVAWEQWLDAPISRERINAETVAIAAFCWDQAQNPDRARRLIERHADLLKTGTLRWGDQRLPLPASVDQVFAWIHRPPPSASVPSDDWTLFRRDATRTSHSSTIIPGLRPQWHTATTRWKDSFGPDPTLEEDLDYFDRLEKTFRNAATMNLPLLPAMHPLIVGEFAIFRTYRSLQGVDLRTGQLRWESGEQDPSVDYLLSQISPSLQQATNRSEQIQSLLRHRTWENLSYGTLSSDGERVYSIEGSGFPGNFAFNNNPHHPLFPQEFNRLVAHDVKTGRLLWEVGSQKTPSETPGEMGEIYFLGPPLPWNDQLFCLGEIPGEVRLWVLNRADGKLLWSQTLVEVDAPLQYDPLRRFSGLTPSAVDGLLICPTGLQTIVAVDLTTQSLRWGKQIPDRSTTDSVWTNAPQPRQRFIGRPLPVPDLTHWSDGPPVISGNSLLLSPRESQELLCLDVWDGSLRWKRPRGELLYVASIFQNQAILVGRNQVEAVDLNTGSAVWPSGLPITAPAGRGFLSGSYYFLPLANHELLTIDVERGTILARRRWWGEKPLGNLVASSRGVLSQSYDAVQALPSLEQLAEEQQVSLTPPPRDAPGWTLRGEIQLHRRDFSAANDSFQHAWSMGKDRAVRDLWISSLLEQFRIAPEQSRILVQSIPPEIPLDSPWGGTWLTARLRDLQQQRETSAAWELIWNALKRPQELLPERRDVQYAVRRDVSLPVLLRELLQSAPPSQRTAIETNIRQAWTETATAPELRRRLLTLTRTSDIGERLQDEFVLRPVPTNLEQEILCLRRNHLSDPQRAGTATAALSALALERREYSTAQFWVQRLRERYLDLPVSGKRTGKELLTAWESGTESLRLPKPVVWPAGAVRIQRESETPREQAPYFVLPLSEGVSAPLPYRLQVDQVDVTTLRAINEQGEEVWSQPLMESFASISEWRYHAVGHLLIVSNGLVLWAIDTLHSPIRILWREVLCDSGQPIYSPDVITPLFNVNWRRRRQSRVTDPYGRPGGLLVFANELVVVVQKDHQLHGLDPLTGQKLWIRYQVPARYEVFAEEDHLCLVDPEHPLGATLLRLEDGSTLGTPAIPTGTKLLTPQPGGLLISSTEPSQLVVRLFHLLKQQDTWKQTFPDQTRVIPVDARSIAAWLPDGTLQLINLADGKISFQTKLSPPTRRSFFQVLPRTDRVLVLNWSLPEREQESHRIRGTLQAFDATGARPVWTRAMDHPTDLYGQSESHPVLVLIEHRLQTPGLPFSPRTSQRSLQVLDIRTGEVLHQYDNQNLTNSVLIFSKPEQHLVQVRHPHTSQPFGVDLTFTDQPKVSPPAKPSSPPATPPAKVTPPPPTPKP